MLRSFRSIATISLFVVLGGIVLMTQSAAADVFVVSGTTTKPDGGAADHEDTVNWDGTSDNPAGAWHRMAQLSDGSWLQVLTIFPSRGRSELHIFASNDSARSWTEISSVNDGQRLVDNGFLYQAPNGDVLLAGRNMVKGESYKISQWRSTDQGRTWTREPDLASHAGPEGVYEPFYYSLPNGRVAVMWSDETYRNYSQVIVQQISEDDGQTWGTARIVVSDGKTGRPGMPSVTRMANGQYLMAYEVCGTRDCEVYSKKSSDGVKWPGGIGGIIPGHVCGPFISSLSNGRIMVTSCHGDSDSDAVPVSYSDDYGATWHSTAPAFTGAGEYGGWPAIYQTGPDEIVALNDSHIRFGTLQADAAYRR